MDIISKFGERLGDFLFENEWTAEDLSKKIGSSKTRVYEWLSGKSKNTPTLTNLLKLANLFNCSLGYLIGIEDNNIEPSKRVRPAFSCWFRFVVKEKGFTLYSLGKKTNITTNHFYKWINGQREPSLDSLLRISEALDCSLDYLVGRE
ncbi:MAG: helix-turn-helix domain-containing protein [Firmicutes bacterium]|nr:helix-turn-helix domain-containing protein [Bacillota bacterium]